MCLSHPDIGTQMLQKKGAQKNAHKVIISSAIWHEFTLSVLIYLREIAKNSF